MRGHRVPVKGRVLSRRRLGPAYYELTLAAPRVVECSRPGQFVMVRVGPWLDPLLRRPLSLSSWDEETGALRLWIERAGRGTTALETLQVGDELDLLGPLGQGFPPACRGDELLVVGGGIGVAPLMQLVAQATRAGAGVRACLGARSAAHLLGVDELTRLGARVEVATDDGSNGHRGLVTELVEREMKSPPTVVMACGPWPMLKRVQAIAAHFGLGASVSLEAHMACGVGACQGCAVKAADQAGYYRVCADGPVFCSTRLDWDAGEGRS